MKISYPRFAVGSLVLVVLLLYPLAIWYLRDRVGVFSFGVVLVVALTVRLLMVATRPLLLVAFAVAAVGFLAGLAYTDSELLLKLYPTFINLTCLTMFALTLLSPPSMIERIARLAGTQITPLIQTYTRWVTVVWCVFFALNAAITTWLAVYAAAQTWALYTGFYAYLAVGTLFGAEYLYRGYFQRRHAHASAGVTE